MAQKPPPHPTPLCLHAPALPAGAASLLLLLVLPQWCARLLVSEPLWALLRPAQGSKGSEQGAKLGYVHMQATERIYCAWSADSRVHTLFLAGKAGRCCCCCCSCWRSAAACMPVENVFPPLTSLCHTLPPISTGSCTVPSRLLSRSETLTIAAHICPVWTPDNLLYLMIYVLLCMPPYLPPPTDGASQQVLARGMPAWQGGNHGVLS